MSYTGICLKRLRKAMKNVGLDCQSLGIILTPHPPPPPRIKRKRATHYCYYISPAVCPHGCFNQSYIGSAIPYFRHLPRVPPVLIRVRTHREAYDGFWKRSFYTFQYSARNRASLLYWAGLWTIFQYFITDPTYTTERPSGFSCIRPGDPQLPTYYNHYLETYSLVWSHMQWKDRNQALQVTWTSNWQPGYQTFNNGLDTFRWLALAECSRPSNCVACGDKQTIRFIDKLENGQAE
jgi:hypothetical protein